MTLVGRLVKNPEITHAGAHSKCDFTVAVSRPFKKGEADFINCVAWNKTAETVVNWFQKGSWISVIGSIRTDSYEKDGRKNFSTKVNVERIGFVGDKKNNDQTENANGYQANETYQEKTPHDFMEKEEPFANIESQYGTSSDDLPF